jgi:hypothetical protein
MLKTSKAILAIAISVGALVGAQGVAVAQDAGTSAGAEPKQTQRAQRKAERKAARAKKNADLSALEKNGYHPGGSQTNYPQDLQNAQRKLDAKKGASESASSAP